MRDLPSRAALTALADAANLVAPSAIVGFSRPMPDGRVSVLFAHPRGMGGYTVPLAELPAALDPSAPDISHLDAAAIAARASNPI